ncbi:allophanate hydrolase subunit 2-domain-containing protein [Penicillium angulare]|uniref:Allophanate hydrolase subunit 2-domain-containing protein n=1 Tax=Penicillium angulare TaxID=116970 RepID=A0A9W9G8R0_9EURO|nr:allophanate hydrolase subunit 2-domain-containing protein [Penicillium angulare]
MRFLPVNSTSILVELEDLDDTLALLSSLQTSTLIGIKEIIPAARTLLIHYQPEQVTAEQLANEISKRELSANPSCSNELIEMPVCYDGEDLEHVAYLTKLSVEEVIRRHSKSEFTVAFCGFAPGFAYLTGGDPALNVPRHTDPRTVIPAGSVALAGSFSGVYPQSSPGGWQLIGKTSVKIWDLSRSPCALFQPGNRVRFVKAEKSNTGITPDSVTSISDVPNRQSEEGTARFKVHTAPFPALFQDFGRCGQASQGISTSGALDRSSLKAANRIVGNPVNTPCLEIIPGGFCFESFARVVIGYAGAPCQVKIQDIKGHIRTITSLQPSALEPGDTVKFGHAQAGVRCYLAVRGGFEVSEVLGSASTDTLANLGPSPVTAGTVLRLRKSKERLVSVSLHETPTRSFPVTGGVVVLDVVLGPRTDWFTSKGLETFTEQHWNVTPDSSRVGARLSGQVPIERKNSNVELPSEGTVTGAIQVPPTGQPVLFLTDHPLTGGYPVIGAVARHHLDLIGQLPVNCKIRFRCLAPFAEIKLAAR